jgi:asparagine synthase (glutamine-hydrolysing)
MPSHVLSGYMRDMREIEPMPTDFDELLGGARHRGFPVDTLRRLLKRDLFDGLIAKLEQRLREVYAESCELERQRPTRFFLAHDWRSHAGGVPWKLSFGSWPVLPILDRKLLEVLFALPDESLFNRRAEEEIIRRRFPDLARLPVDRNNYDRLPLLPSPAQRVTHRLGVALDPIRRRIPRSVERRYFHRIYDINNPGWSAVRRTAEPYRDRLADIVEMDVLGELVPAPETQIAIEHKVRDGVMTKQLVGLMLWSANYLS